MRLKNVQYNLQRKIQNKIQYVKQKTIKYSTSSNNSQQPSLHEKFKKLDYDDIKELYKKLVIDREILIAHEKIKIINSKINLIIYGSISAFSIGILYISTQFIMKKFQKNK
jgi:hypothetical protein